MKKFILFLLISCCLSLSNNVWGQDCEIEVLVLETSACEDGAYNIELIYGITNSMSDSVDVWINNNFVGQFEISNDALFLEDIPSNGETIGTLLICSNNDTECCFVYVFEQPECESEETCEIDFELEWSECSEDGTYTLFIHYEVTNPDNDFLELWVNNEYEGIFEIDPSGSGTITIDDVTPRENSDYDIVEFCVNDNSDCCYAEEYMPPCENEGEGECEIGFELEWSECDENGTYTLFIHYEVFNPNNDFLDLWVNNEYEGIFEIDPSGSGTITIQGVTPRENSDYDIVELCVNDNENCCHVEEFMPPCENEEEPCEIIIEVETTECVDGMFDITIYYEILGNTENVFTINVNGIDGEFEMDPSGVGSIVIEEVLPASDEFENFVTICINEFECCEEYFFEAPCETAACDVTFILDWGECINGTYDLYINYTVTNPTDDLFDLWVNNEYEGVFEIDPSGSGVILIDDVTPRENSDYDIVELCVNDNENCCHVEEFMPPECSEGCSIDIEIETGECVDGVYTLIVYYNTTGSEDEVVEIYLDGNLLGEFEIDASGEGAITIDEIESDGSEISVIGFCVDDGTCCEELDFEVPNCEGEEPCEIGFELEWSDCSEDGTYTLFIHYTVVNPGNEFLDLWVNNEFEGNFDIDASGSGIITIEGVTPRENSDYDIVVLCVNDNENCCYEAEFMPPCENEDACSIAIEVDVFDCVDGTYNLIVFFDITGSNDNFIDLYVNGNLIGEFEIDPNGSGAITVENIVPLTGTDFDVVTICTNDSQCCLEFEYAQPACEDDEECLIEFEVSYPDCIEGGTFVLEIEYTVSGTTQELVDVWINGNLYGSYEIDPSGSGVLVLEQVVPDPNSILVIVDVCVNDQPDCCHTVEFELEECGGIQDDLPPYQLYNENGSSRISITTLPNIELNYQVYSSSGQLVNYKNKVTGTDQIEIGFKGIYFIRIEANRNVFYHKMLSIQ